jgi:hypothetical protein
MLENREGGCHCGRVRFRARVDLDLLSQCSCTVCTKKGILHLPVALRISNCCVARTRCRPIHSAPAWPSTHSGSIPGSEVLCGFQPAYHLVLSRPILPWANPAGANSGAMFGAPINGAVALAAQPRDGHLQLGRELTARTWHANGTTPRTIPTA